MTPARAFPLTISTLAALVVGLLVVALPAAAEEPARPCAADVQRLCGDVEPGEGRVQACLDQHRGDLSGACQARIAEVRSDLGDAQAACGDDAERVCGDVEPGKGRVVHCLIERKDQLSGDCRAKLARAGGEIERRMEEKKAERQEHRAEAKEAMQGKMDGIQDACAADVEAFCNDVEPGKGRVLMCLRRHAAEVSEGCKASFR